MFTIILYASNDALQCTKGSLRIVVKSKLWAAQETFLLLSSRFDTRTLPGVFHYPKSRLFLYPT
jgi:hypothetical protein